MSGGFIIPYIFSAQYRILMRFNTFIIGWLLLSLPFSCLWYWTTFILKIHFWPLTLVLIYFISLYELTPHNQLPIYRYNTILSLKLNVGFLGPIGEYQYLYPCLSKKETMLWHISTRTSYLQVRLIFHR